MTTRGPALLVLVVVAVLTGGCGQRTGPLTSSSSTSTATNSERTPVDPTVNPTTRPRSGDVLVAALGDSITAGSPRWDPDPAVRKQIGDRLDEMSQYEYWYHASHPRYRFRNCGIFGQRTDEIAKRLEDCARGAQVLVVQGGINDIAQGRPVADAGRDIAAMLRAGKKLGLKVATVEVLPWNNGYPKAAPLITELNTLIHGAAKAAGVPVMPWYAALEDPDKPGRMRAALTIDGNHPSVAGYQRLAARTELP